MLFTVANDFNWSVDNFGSTYSNAGIGINSPGHVLANTKGANTTMIAGSSITEDVYGILIGFSGGDTSATIRRNLVDVLIDPAGGTSWSILINNLYANSPNFAFGGYWYYFPIYLKNGTSIGTSNQSLTAATSALRVMIRVFGKPSRPDIIRVGSKVETFGAVTASTSGTAITPGNAVMGALTASLGTTANDLFWWQAGLGFNDTNVAALGTMMDVLAGDGTNNEICAEGILFANTSSESSSKMPFGTRLPQCVIKAGANVYMRAYAGAAPETTPTVVAYGCG